MNFFRCKGTTFFTIILSYIKIFLSIFRNKWNIYEIFI